MDQGVPFLIVLKSQEAEQFFVVIEKQMMTDSGSVACAIVDLIATYFTFDVYPQSLYPLLIFIQHYMGGWIVPKVAVVAIGG